MKHGFKVYFFHGDVPKEFPFIHATPRDDCIVSSWESDEPFSEEEKKELARKTFEDEPYQFNRWYKSYTIYP